MFWSDLDMTGGGFSISADEMLCRSGVGCVEVLSVCSGSPESLEGCEKGDDLLSFSTSLLFSSMMGLTVRALL